MKKIAAILIIFTLFSCQKNNEVKVTYQASGAVSEFSLNYTNAEGNLVNVVVTPQSALDSWNYSFVGEQGDIVYVSGKYSDPYSGLKLMIKVNGKVYKQASNEGDTLKYLTVSGVVPYN